MEMKVRELSVEELKNLIAKTVHEAIEDYLEDLKAISSKDFISSIKEAREDYKSGETKNFNEIF